MARLSAIALLLLGLVASAIAGPRIPPRWRTVEKYIEKRPEHNILIDLLDTYDLDDTLELTFRGTFIAPTNLAFIRSSDAAAELSGNQIEAVLKYHVVPGVIINATADFAANRTLATAFGANITLSLGANNTRLVNGVPVRKVTPIGNGKAQVLVVQSILMPPNLPEKVLDGKHISDCLKIKPELASALAAVEATGLEGDLDNRKDEITAWIPNNDAFLEIKNVTANMTVDKLKEILLLHVSPQYVQASQYRGFTYVPTLNGIDVKLSRFDYENRVNGVSIVDTLFCGKAKVYVIDKVLIPPARKFASVAAFIKANPNLSTAHSLIQKYNLTAALNDTALAASACIPNNGAFAAVSSILPNLTDAQVVDILKFHVAAPKVMPSQFTTEGLVVPTLLANASSTFRKNATGLFVNDARVWNSVLVGGGNANVHILTKVMLPPSA